MKQISKTFLTCMLLSNFSSTASSQGIWSELPATLIKRTESTAATIGSKIYLLGGFTPKGISRKLDVWDSTSRTWSRGEPLPRGLHHTTASVVNGKLYVIGGFDSSTWRPVRTNYEYDPATNLWTVKSSMPTARGAHAAAVIEGKIYLIGGVHRKLFRLVNTTSHEMYDPKTNTWKTQPPIPTGRDHLTASAIGNTLYAIGGRMNLDYNRNLNINESYDVKTRIWTQRSQLPTARSGITSQILNGWIHVFGGESEEKTFVQNEAYNPKADKWKLFKPMPSGRHGLASVVIDEKIHILTGGAKPGGKGSDIHYIFKLK